MVSKNQIKFIKGLQQKKCRIDNRLFIAEGEKIIREFLTSKYQLHIIYSTSTTLFSDYVEQREIISEVNLKQISALKAPNKAIAIFKFVQEEKVNFKELVLGVDELRDPGNLGTIIRLCDWFGIQSLVCSKNTVEVYNPKVVQAAMGSLSRVNVVYKNLESIVLRPDVQSYGAVMNGENIHQLSLPKHGFLIMGNESNGISPIILKHLKHKITIPKFGTQQTESLNVAMATAILLNEFRRGII